MLIIGERLSVMSKKVREAMQARDAEVIKNIALVQKQYGAGMIDANIGPAEDDGEELMIWMVETIQDATHLPICLDTTNINAVEAGLKAHNNAWGNAMINSTSNDPERYPMLELAAKYQCDIIALTAGKGGLPADAEARCEHAAELMAKAMEYGLPLENMYLDPLVLQIATTQEQVSHVIEAVKMFKELNDPPMKSVVGLSNVSNGCPKELRPMLNNTFSLLLMQAGLDAAIVNPKEALETIKTFDVMMGNTLYAHSYLEV